MDQNSEIYSIDPTKEQNSESYSIDPTREQDSESYSIDSTKEQGFENYSIDSPKEQGSKIPAECLKFSPNRISEFSTGPISQNHMRAIKSIYILQNQCSEPEKPVKIIALY